jgi:putative transposase
VNTSIAHFSPQRVVLHPQAIHDRFRIFGFLRTSAEEAAREAFKALLEELLDLYITWLLGRPKGAPPRRIDHTCVSWRCRRCGSQTRRHFQRNGHYRRAIVTRWGRVTGIQVPMVRCQRCGGYVAGVFPFLRKRARLWDDLLEQALLDCSLGLSLRQQIERQVAEGLCPVGLQALNRRVNDVRPTLLRMREVPFVDIPPIVQCDGLYLSVMERTRQMKRDACHRLRCRLRKRQRVALVALGLWPDGRHQVLGWALADSESEEAWRDFLLQQYARGLTPEAGLRLLIGDGARGLKNALDFVYYGQVPGQLCHFHKIRRIVYRDYLLERAHRGQLLQDAGQVLAGQTRTEVYSRLRVFCQKWQELEPLSVRCFLRDFNRCLAYLEVPGLEALPFARTTSHAERLMRELRRKVRHLGPLVTDVGADAALGLLFARLNGRWLDRPWLSPLVKAMLEAA